MDDYGTIKALYPFDVEMEPLAQSLRDNGVSDSQIALVTPLPLSERASARIGSMPFYAFTFVAGLLGIGIGVFFAGGTAALYPLMTGGKPIISVPIVGIISYETMMLSAIVVTFIIMIVSIKRSHRAAVQRDTRIDDGYIMVVVSLPPDPACAVQIRELLQRADPVEIHMLNPLSPESSAPNARAVAVALVGLCWFAVFAGCSRDMQEQPSYQPQEAPRLHSPSGSVPRDSRSVIQVTGAPAQIDEGARLFRINCVHCHGAQATGEGPVAPYLKEKPSNLLDRDVQELSVEALYDTVTNGLAIDGRDVMPPFKGELSAGERRSVAAYVKSLSQS